MLQGGTSACVYIRITMDTVHQHALPCSKVSPVNIAIGAQSLTDIKFSSAGGIPLIIFIVYTWFKKHAVYLKNISKITSYYCAICDVNLRAGLKTVVHLLSCLYRKLTLTWSQTSHSVDEPVFVERKEGSEVIPYNPVTY